MYQLLIVACLVKMSQQNVVNTAQGKLRGEQNDGFVSYNGIPYGTVKNADVRFKQAGLAPLWNETRDSTRSTCAARFVEECLRLDVHVPKAVCAPCPVLVWVPGSDAQYHPDRLVKQDIIVVIVHHRLGPLGFLCTKEQHIPGNAGAKDVVLALRWVRDNIVAFRGNHAHVVVGGQGFGAAIVEGLMLSHMAEGLFHGAIMQSGSILSPWAFNYDAEERSLALGKMYTVGDAMASYLLKANNVDLVDKADKLSLPYFPFGMCVENGFKREERFLSEPPFDMLSNGKVRRVPLMIGFNSNEGYIFARVLKQVKILRKIAADFNIILQDEIKFFNDREIKIINEIYFDREVNMNDILAFHRDVYFVNHVHRSARFHASGSNIPVYYYQFSHTSSFGVEEESGVPKYGAAHSDELALLFPVRGQELDGDDGDAQRNLIRLWTNFVKYLEPTRPGEQPVWTATDAHHLRLLNIGTQLEMIDYPHERASRLWDDLYERQYYKKLRNTI